MIYETPGEPISCIYSAKQPLTFTEIYENFTQKDQVQSRQRPAAQKSDIFILLYF